jgi:hypothetical protein
VSTEQDLSAGLRQMADSAPAAVQGMVNLSRALDRLSASLRDRRLRREAGVPVPVEDGGNRDTDTWRTERQVSPEPPMEWDRSRPANQSGVPVPALSRGQFFDGTSWRTRRPGHYVAQGHP